MRMVKTMFVYTHNGYSYRVNYDFKLGFFAKAYDYEEIIPDSDMEYFPTMQEAHKYAQKMIDTFHLKRKDSK